MIPTPQTLTLPPSPDSSDLRLRRAFELLQDAFRRAAELQVDVWQLASELEELCGAGARQPCFLLTAKDTETQVPGLSEEGTRPKDSSEAQSGGHTPQWDRERRRLLWRGRVVKQLRVPAPNQELILSAFEEEGWPPRIDDPLPLCPEMDPKARLHEAIKSLNRRHLHKGLRFRGDGSGRGILWVGAGSR